MTRNISNRQLIVAAAVSLLIPAVASAQTPHDAEIERAKMELEKASRAMASGFYLAREAEILHVEPLVPRAGVRNAPFSADAVTEFTQVLGDGNRIEREYTTSIARDSNGRTRREQEIAMLGPLASLQGQEPRLVIITDPAAGFDYTLDQQAKTATRLRNAIQIRGKLLYQAGQTLEFSLGVGGRGDATQHVFKAAGPGVRVATAVTESKVTTEQLGARQIEGISADGTRTTMTIPAGAVGNVNPIDVVTERWFSKDLQMEVLISRRDPRAGDTVYRLTNIVRTEPPPDLFVVPPDYTIRNQENPMDGKMIELRKSLESLEKPKK
jgi:hypothetical protein